jgi:hypothetical protein
VEKRRKETGKIKTPDFRSFYQIITYGAISRLKD